MKGPGGYSGKFVKKKCGKMRPNRFFEGYFPQSGVVHPTFPSLRLEDKIQPGAGPCTSPLRNQTRGLVSSGLTLLRIFECK